MVGYRQRPPAPCALGRTSEAPYGWQGKKWPASLLVAAGFIAGQHGLFLNPRPWYVQRGGVVTSRRFYMSENIKSETISRRKIFSLLGLAAVFSLAVPAAVLSLSDEAEAQTTTTTGTRGQQRRAGRTERRQTRRTGRTERRAIRRGTAAPQQ